MPSWLLHLSLGDAAIVIPLYVLAAALGVYLLWRAPHRTHRAARLVLLTLGAAILGAVLGLVACWLVSDVWNVFDVALTPGTRLWVALACAGVAAAIANLFASRIRRKVIAVVAIPVFLGAAAVGINNDFGMHTSVADLLGVNPYPVFDASTLPAHPDDAAADLLATWRPSGEVPAHGTVVQATIPATESHFPARPAMLYLPPAAFAANAPQLPVIIALSGQPGTPSNMVASAQMPKVLDAYAAEHHGLAPIVVVPDQLGSPDANPMCVDSPLGNSATYLTVDVPRWIQQNLHVASPGRSWAITGFSQGGTCSIQLGAGHPELFGTILDISGEAEPTIGANTVAKAFGGSQAAYDAAKPVNILAAHAPYPDTVAIFGVGADDAKYTARLHIVEQAAAAAGMQTSTIVSPHTAHDWNTVRYVMREALPQVADRLLSAP